MYSVSTSCLQRPCLRPVTERRGRVLRCFPAPGLSLPLWVIGQIEVDLVRLRHPPERSASHCVELELLAIWSFAVCQRPAREVAARLVDGIELLRDPTHVELAIAGTWQRHRAVAEDALEASRLSLSFQLDDKIVQVSLRAHVKGDVHVVHDSRGDCGG
jgi:hypothetical protein